mgnify:CR=1 FL=1
MMTDNSMQTIRRHADAGAKLRMRFFDEQADLIRNVALRIAVAMASGNKLLICGNGGSAADAQHMAAEFVNRFLIDRPPLPAIALTTDSSIITAVGNDFGFDLAFAKQVAALGKAGDILLAISTSGNSKNILLALDEAKKLGMLALGLTGKGGGAMAPLCDLLINVDDASTPLIQEIHITVEHLLCELTDYFLFENVAALTPYLNAEKDLPL